MFKNLLYHLWNNFCIPQLIIIKSNDIKSFPAGLKSSPQLWFSGRTLASRSSTCGQELFKRGMGFK